MAVYPKLAYSDIIVLTCRNNELYGYSSRTYSVSGITASHVAITDATEEIQEDIKWTTYDDGTVKIENATESTSFDYFTGTIKIYFGVPVN